MTVDAVEATHVFMDGPGLALGDTTYWIRPDRVPLWSWHDSFTLKVPVYDIFIRLKPEDAEIARAFMIAAAL